MSLLGDSKMNSKFVFFALSLSFLSTQLYAEINIKEHSDFLEGLEDYASKILGFRAVGTNAIDSITDPFSYAKKKEAQEQQIIEVAGDYRIEAIIGDRVKVRGTREGQQWLTINDKLGDYQIIAIKGNEIELLDTASIENSQTGQSVIKRVIGEEDNNPNIEIIEKGKGKTNENN